MAKKLELNFSSSKDAEIVRFIQLNSEENTSPLMISALEYYIKTGNFLKIGKVCIKPQLTEKKIRKPIYVPQNSVVEEWAEEQKKERKGLLTSKVRYILKNSLEVVANVKDESVSDPMELIIAVDRLSKKQTIYEDVQPIKEDIPDRIEPVQEKPPDIIYQQVGAVDMNFDPEPAREPVKKPKNRGVGMLDKMMPINFDE